MSSAPWRRRRPTNEEGVAIPSLGVSVERIAPKKLTTTVVPGKAGTHALPHAELRNSDAVAPRNPPRELPTHVIPAKAGIHALPEAGWSAFGRTVKTPISVSTPRRHRVPGSVAAP